MSKKSKQTVVFVNKKLTTGQLGKLLKKESKLVAKNSKMILKEMMMIEDLNENISQ